MLDTAIERLRHTTNRGDVIEYTPRFGSTPVQHPSSKRPSTSSGTMEIGRLRPRNLGGGLFARRFQAVAHVELQQVDRKMGR